MQLKTDGRLAPKPKKTGPKPVEVIARDCIAVRVRAIYIYIKFIYDNFLRSHGLRVGQLNLLVAIARMGTARPGDLCRRLMSWTSPWDLEIARRAGAAHT